MLMTSHRGMPWAKESRHPDEQDSARVTSPMPWQRTTAMTLVTVEDLRALQAAAFDGRCWILPDIADAMATRMEVGNLIERHGGGWRLRPRAFRVRLFGDRCAPDLPGGLHQEEKSKLVEAVVEPSAPAPIRHCDEHGSAKVASAEGVTDDEVRNLIRGQALPYVKGRARSTGVTAWGIANGVSRGGLCRFMTGKRRPGADLLEALGLEWRIARDAAAWIGGDTAGVTEEEVRALVRQRAAPYAVHRLGSTGLMAWAAAHRVHQSTLSTFMAKKGPPGSDLLDALALEWRVFHKRIGEIPEAIGGRHEPLERRRS